ncbi:hypothetical protein HYH02_002657 [Chlamydomonas schloesseri]|uniref:EGF-like domain-containing protein n=1 Tax=Chlamydomonas schloesseri TaxID=2026947 RepID=A0A835WQU8_9CHLO|nr:hypothetical protein HYH02_002657 [Chlamydomonas schloesseri]|eukprot:KAG2452414.1 hypothetical protein HYH02_002657 [Chlamydomonas schloesseri]
MVNSSDPVRVYNQQAIQVVFSRPVIALGSDFGDGAAAKQVPFRLSCGVPGRFRWVSTTTARWDPDVDWPPDLSCGLRWNTSLRAYDGARLALDGIPPRRALATSSLYMYSGGVVSEAAARLTGGAWSADAAGAEDDKAPEVPPDGKLMLQFSYPVNLLMLKSAFVLLRGSDEAVQEGGPSLPYTLKPCWLPATALPALAAPPAADNAALLNVNATCAAVELGAALQPDTWYTLRLPVGTRYSALAGPTSNRKEVVFAGLRRFRFPLVRDPWRSSSPSSGISYRHLELWLPHGLQPGTSLESLARVLSVCELQPAAAPAVAGDEQQPEACVPGAAPLPFTLTLPALSRLRMTVPGLMPGKKYRVTAGADPTVKDGFGLSLEDSNSTDFYMTYIPYRYEGPDTGGGTYSYSGIPLAVLEPQPTDGLTHWPYITIAPPPRPAAAEDPPYTSRTVRSFALDMTNGGHVTKLLQLFQRNYPNAAANGDPTAHLGLDPASVVPVPEALTTPGSGAGWSLVQAPLQPGAAVQVLDACCGPPPYVGGPPNRRTQVVVRSGLSLSVVNTRGTVFTAWVTDASEGGGGAGVAGTTVSFHVMPTAGAYQDGSQNLPFLAASCVTGADGTCSVDIPPSDSGQPPEIGDRIAAVAVAPPPPPGATSPAATTTTRVALLVDALYVESRPPPPSATRASLVADRRLVRPGESLKLTGFVARESLSGMQLPPASWGVLEVSSGWGESASGSVTGRRRSAAATTSTAVGGSSTPPLLELGSGSSAVRRAQSRNEYDLSSGVLVNSGDSSKGWGDSSSSSRSTSRRALRQQAEAPPDGYGAPPDPEPYNPPPRVLVEVNASSGSIHGEIQVPYGARQQPYSVALYLPAAVGSYGTAPLEGPPPDLSSENALAGWNYVRTFDFTVADPRPPTAELQVDVPAWVTPTGIFTVTATAVSYIGAAVGGAPMTLTWRHARASGVLRLTTDVNGVATATVDLGALPEDNRTTTYDTVAVSVEWIGPTRERVVETKTITLADTEYALTYSLSLTPDRPGVPFGVAAVLTSNTDGSVLSGAPVTATLTPAAPGTLGGAACDTVVTCTTTSGSGFVGPSPCRLSLPCLGRFSLRVCSALTPAAAGGGGGSSTQVCGRFETALGRNATEWQQYGSKLRSQPMPPMFLDKDQYALGETPRLRFESPWPHARLLVTWGNSFATQSKVVEQLPSGTMAEVDLGPLTHDNCAGGCVLTAVLHVPRLAPSDMPLPPPDLVPVSVLYDPLAPLTYSSSLSIAVVDDNGLELLAIEPGQKAEVSVRVAGAAPGTEVTVYGVDQAVLDLVPYGLAAPQRDLVLRLAADIRAYGMAAYRLAPGSVRAVFDTLVRRLSQLDPWLPLDIAVRKAAPYSGSYWSSGGAGLSAADMSDGEFLDQYATAITMFAGGYSYADGIYKYRPLAPSKRRQPPYSRGERGPPTAPPESGGVAGELRVADDFVTTPLFTTALTGPDGVARVTFTAPANLGTFVIRAHAATTGAAAGRRYGSGEGRLVVRRALSLTASAPRFVRVGDAFEAGCVVTVGSAPATVAVTLTVEGGASSPLQLSAVGASPPSSFSMTKTVTFTAGADLQEEVRFPLSGRAIGTARLTLRAVDTQAGGGSDGLQFEVPVYGQQGDVMVATTFSLTANGTTGGGWVEGVELPAAVPGSGGLTLTAGVGNLPALTAMYANLLQQERSAAAAGDRYPYAERALMWVVLPPLLATYGQPNTSVAQDEQVSRGFADLATLTQLGLGLVWTDFTRWGDWVPSRVDTRLNAWALFLTALHGPALTAPAKALPASGLGRYLAPWTGRLEPKLLPVWRRALARQLVADAAEARESNATYSDWHMLAWARLALGAEWDAGNVTTGGANRRVAADLSLAALIAANGKNASRPLLSRETRVVLSLVLLSMGPSNPEPRLVNATLGELNSAMRLQGRTAYVASGPGEASPASLEDQALVLLLMVRAGSRNPMLPRLAAYVAAGGSSSSALSGRSVYFSASWSVQALAAAALVSYDASRGSAQPRLQLESDANGLTVLKAFFRRGRTQPVTNTTAWEALPPPPVAGQPGELNFKVSGTGEVSVSAALQFVPMALPAFPTYRGIYVEAAVQVVDPATGEGAGPRVSGVPLGSVVALTIQVTSPDELGAVTLAVMMPGGLEPLDPNVVTDIGSGCDLSSWGDGGGGGFGRGMRSRWWYWWPVCPAQETTPPLVTFSYASLRAGTSTVTIKAVAASAGNFVLPPIRAWAEAQPELMGTTAGSSFVVCSDCSAPTPATPPAAPVPCPALDCSGNGVCNLANGTCECDAGWTGKVCGKADIA